MSGTANRESESLNLGGGDQEGNSLNPPAPAPRVSLPVRFADPNDSNSERSVYDITPDVIFVRTGTSVTETEYLIQNVSTTIEEVDRFVGVTRDILDQTIHEGNMNREEQHNMIDMQDLAQNLPNGTFQQNGTDAEHSTGARQSIPAEDSLGSDAISLEAALKLLPYSFNGENQEEMEIFLEKCDFALSCTSKQVQGRLLQGITVRLTGKARQAIKFRTFETWATLRDTLKAALEPQRTTTHLFLELYSSKQKLGEDVLTYSSRIEKLQNLIVEQETNGKSLEVAKALEASFKQQVVQVFIEGLGPLKDFIKARNPTTLEKAIQAAREEERVRRSAEESKKLYNLPKKVPEGRPKMCFNCNKVGHWAKDCKAPPDREPRVNRTGPSYSRSVHIITCQYCKKPGHTKDVCRKLKYVERNRNNPHNKSENLTQHSGNPTPSTSNGGRSAGSLKTAVVTFPQSS